jgi:putative NADH-flavin reductase
MKVTIFGATGLLGRECLSQCLEAGHEVTVLARTPSKLPAELRDRITIIEGDGLDPGAVEQALAGGTDAILFAVGIDRRSPEDLCTDVTRNILTSMRKLSAVRTSSASDRSLSDGSLAPSWRSGTATSFTRSRC